MTKPKKDKLGYVDEDGWETVYTPEEGWATEYKDPRLYWWMKQKLVRKDDKEVCTKPPHPTLQ